MAGVKGRVSALIASDRATRETEEMMDRNGGMIICSTQRAIKGGGTAYLKWQREESY